MQPVQDSLQSLLTSLSRPTYGPSSGIVPPASYQYYANHLQDYIDQITTLSAKLLSEEKRKDEKSGTLRVWSRSSLMAKIRASHRQ